MQDGEVVQTAGDQGAKNRGICEMFGKFRFLGKRGVREIEALEKCWKKKAAFGKLGQLQDV